MLTFQEIQAKTTEAVQALEFECILCDFKSKWENGLGVNMAKKHSRIPQLDGNIENDTDENFADDKYSSTKHYWARGYLGGGYQTYIDAVALVDEMELSMEEKNQEKNKILE